jgi:hypothetical protein
MKRSESSVLGERIRQRRAVTPVKPKVRKVKFTPGEMAYQMPDDLSHLKYRRATEGRTVVIHPDLAKVFPDESAVNNALRKLIEAVPAAKRRKTA